MLIAVLLFIICICASGIGAIVGAGGGIIIKPVVDAMGLLPASTVSFMSSSTVLAMSVSSLIRTRNNGVKLDMRISTPVAIGAVIGGIAGNALFNIVRAAVNSESLLKGVQSAGMLAVMALILVYICVKDHLPTKHVKSIIAAVLIGASLGLIGSFLGIGGGPNNVAFLIFFFSMDAKQAAKNSIYVILFSQAANLLVCIISGRVPAFEPVQLAAMICGGIGGALIGAAASKHMNNKNVETMLKLFIIAGIVITVLNIVTSFAG